MGLLVDEEFLELLRRGDEEIVHKTMYEKLDELYSASSFSPSVSELELMHYGKAHDANPPGRGSGRLPWGSGERKLQHQWDIYARYQKLKGDINPVTGKKYTDPEIAKILGFYQVDKNGNYILDENGEPKGNSTQLRARYSYAKNYVRENYYVAACQELAGSIDPDTGKLYTNTKIGKMLGIGESSVRNYLNSEQASKNANKITEVADQIKKAIDEKGVVDVGTGVEYGLGCSRQTLNSAFEILKDQGYKIDNVWIDQVGGMNGNKTTILTARKPDIEYKDVYQNLEMIKPLSDLNGDSSLTALGIQDPVRVDLDRVKIRYDDDPESGKLRDGMIEIRAKYDDQGRLVAACEDLDLGNAKYAQVRIATAGDKYIKGMAVLNPDLPSNVDILVNSNKSREKGVEGALKDMKQRKDKDGNEIGVDLDNPFGATVWQYNYKDSQGNEKLSPINIVGDLGGVDKHIEGAWNNWSRNLPAQVLSKQNVNLIKSQLDIKVKEMKAEYDEILKINNPVVKKQMLNDFAESCDGAAVDLKAAPLPGQRVQVLLSAPSLKENEIFAPNYQNGQLLALVRYPHAGPWETAIVKVNNHNKEAETMLVDRAGSARDAICVNPKTLGTLSGADCDGDTATVIPMNRKNSQGQWVTVANIKGIGNGQAPLPDLQGFDPCAAFPEHSGMHYMSKREKQLEMGKTTNLIMDMQMTGNPTPDELSRATRHSMVVIDAEKHKLDYKAAEKVYNIQELKNKYQNGGGAATLLTKAGSEYDVPRRQAWSPSKNSINPETGEKIYKNATNLMKDDYVKVKVPAPEGYTWTDKNGKVHTRAKWMKDENGKDLYQTYPNGKPVMVPAGTQSMRMQKSTKMAEAKDAYELLSTNPSKKELVYADFANKMKSMANTARKEWLATPDLEYSPAAKKKYQEQVDSLNAKYIRAKMNAPRERQAQVIATQTINERVKENPFMDTEELKRVRGQSLNGARSRTGAKKDRVTFTEKEWEAINAGAVSQTRLTELLKNADQNSYRNLALPKSNKVSRSTANYIKALMNAGWTPNEIEDAGYATMATIDKVREGKIE